MAAADAAPEPRGKSGKQNAADGKRKRGLVYLLLLTGIGLLLSIELLRIHLIAVQDPNHNFACRINEKLDCNAVAQSRQALFLGIPVPVFGILTYLVFGALAGIGLKRKDPPGSQLPDYALPLALWSVIYSAYLAYVSAFELKIFCTYCAGLYAVNLGLLFASLLAADPLREWWPRRALDLQWLKQAPVFMGAGIFFLVGGLMLAAGLYYRSSRPETLPLARGGKIDLAHQPVQGYFNAPITILEFSDFECPACRRMHKTVSALLMKYPGQIKLVHFNFPLDSRCNPDMDTRMHPFACDAAAAAECAYRLGKFDDYSERLWQTDDLSVTSLVKMAGEEGMDPELFKKCLAGDETKKAILADVDAAVKIQIDATPTFIVNGYKFAGYQTVKWCSKLIERFLRGEEPTNAGPPLGMPTE